MRNRLLALMLTPAAAWCQTPVVSSLVNAASYQTTWGRPGTIATIFGTNLAATAATAQSAPLPRQLAGTTVTVGGITAPLFYVSPTQINLQIPWGGPNNNIVVSTAVGSSAPYNPQTATPDAWEAGGVFTTDASGCGQGAVLNVAGGSLSLNSHSNSASPGDWIAIYGTGLPEIPYAQFPSSAIGIPAPLSGLVSGETFPGIQVDGAVQYGGEWSGLAPGFVGLDQTNVQLGATVREGCAVPLQAVYAGTSLAMTQPVTIAIRQGGGPCVDPPAAGYGQIVWEKIVSTTAQNVISEADAMIASLQASPGKQAPPAQAGPPSLNIGCPGPGGLCGNTYRYFGPSCPVPGYRSLDAGTVTAQGPGFSVARVPSIPFQQPQQDNYVYEITPLDPGHVAGLSIYQATLPAGTLQAGKFTMTAGGGTDVGAFKAAVNIGADIQIQTPLAGVSSCAFTINWTGGDPQSWVTASLVQYVPTGGYGGYHFVNFYAQSPTSSGTLSVSSAPAGCDGAAEPIQITVEVDPDPSEIATFSVPGLSLGGLVTWRYIHTFDAYLTIE